jgi:hypothetical protein
MLPRLSCNRIPISDVEGLTLRGLSLRNNCHHWAPAGNPLSIHLGHLSWLQITKTVLS